MVWILSLVYIVYIVVLLGVWKTPGDNHLGYHHHTTNISAGEDLNEYI